MTSTVIYETQKALRDRPEVVVEFIDRICSDFGGEEPKTPKKIADEMGLSLGLLLRRINEDQRYYDLYLRALEVRALYLQEETLQIADEATNTDAYLCKMRIEVRQKLAKHWNKRLYGDDPVVQFQQVITDPGQVLMKIDELERRLGLRESRIPKSESLEAGEQGSVQHLPKGIDEETKGEEP